MAGRQYQNVSYGLNQPLNLENPTPIIAKRNPTTSDFAFPTTIWTNTVNNAVFILASVANNTANWVSATGGAGVFTSLTVTPGPISLTGATTINTAGNALTQIGSGGTGQVQIGNTTGNTAVTGTLSATGSIASTTGQIFTTNGTISAGNTAVSTQPPTFQALKSRGGGVITSGDGIGQLLFAGFDGTGYTVGAAITSTSSGTIANTRVAGNLAFITHPDSAGATVTRMTISPAGNVVVNPPDSGVGLAVSSGITATTGNVVLGAVGAGIAFSNGITITAGNADPNGAVAAVIGSLHLVTSGTGVGDRAWINTDGVTAWTAITTAS